MSNFVFYNVTKSHFSLIVKTVGFNIVININTLE